MNVPGREFGSHVLGYRVDLVDDLEQGPPDPEEE
jgi:hypothetical protein